MNGDRLEGRRRDPLLPSQQLRPGIFHIAQSRFLQALKRGRVGGGGGKEGGSRGSQIKVIAVLAMVEKCQSLVARGMAELAVRGPKGCLQ